MDFAWSAEQEQLRSAIERVCVPFDADYWLRKDRDGGFPARLPPCARRRAAGSASRCPRTYGGAGLGISEAALMMHTIAASRAPGCRARRRCT